MTEPIDIANIRREYADHREPAVRAVILALCDRLDAERSVPGPAEWDEMVQRAQRAEAAVIDQRSRFLRLLAEAYEAAGGQTEYAGEHDDHTEGED